MRKLLIVVMDDIMVRKSQRREDYSSKCQFAHGKEQLRPTRLAINYKSEAQACKSPTRAGSCTYGPKSSSVHQLQAAAESEYAVTTSQPASLVKTEPDDILANSNIFNDWSPLMRPLILSCRMVIKLHQGKKFMHIFLVFFMASMLKGDYQHLQNFTRGCDLPRLKGLLTARRY